MQTVGANRFELQIVALSSSLSLNVIGTFKEMVTIGFSVLIFGDPINAINGLGVIVTVSGITLYNRHRYRKMQEAQGRAQPVGGVEHGEAAEGEGERLLPP